MKFIFSLSQPLPKSQSTTFFFGRRSVPFSLSFPAPARRPPAYPNRPLSPSPTRRVFSEARCKKSGEKEEGCAGAGTQKAKDGKRKKSERRLYAQFFSQPQPKTKHSKKKKQMVRPSDERIRAAVLLVLNIFLRERIPGHVDLTELPEELPEGFPWSDLAKALGITSAKDSYFVRKRYIHILAPGLVFGNWQPHEDAIIYREVAAGKGWVAIKGLLKGRSALSIKTR